MAKEHLVPFFEWVEEVAIRGESDQARSRESEAPDVEESLEEGWRRDKIF